MTVLPHYGLNNRNNKSIKNQKFSFNQKVGKLIATTVKKQLYVDYPCGDAVGE